MADGTQRRQIIERVTAAELDRNHVMDRQHLSDGNPTSAAPHSISADCPKSETGEIWHIDSRKARNELGFIRRAAAWQG